MKKIFSKHKKKTIFLIAVIIFLGIYFIFIGNKKTQADTITVQRGPVVSEVSVTGKVVPVKNIDLAFETGGRITNIYVKVGSRVDVGQALMKLSNGDLEAQVAQAEASVRVQRAKLDSLTSGTRQEEITLKETAVSNAETALSDAKKGIITSIRQAYTSADDGVRNKIDQMFIDPQGQSPRLKFTANSEQLQSEIQSMRLKIESTLTSWEGSLSLLSVGGNTSQYINEAKSDLTIIRSFGDKLSLAVNSITQNAQTTQSNIDSWKSALSTARTGFDASLSSLVTAETSYNTSQSALSTAKDNLALARAGSTSQQISEQEAQVTQAEANVSYYKSQLSKTILRAPFSGTITKINFVEGDIVSPTVSIPAVSLIGAGKFEIEAYITESDIAKVKIGDTASVTLDAYGKDVIFSAKVTKTDLSETILDGVATYKTTFQFDSEDERILSGLTANVDILSDKKENVLYIPSRNIYTDGGVKTVKLITDSQSGTTKDVEIQTGLRGSDGRTEIIAGLKEGDKILKD